MDQCEKKVGLKNRTIKQFVGYIFFNTLKL